MPQVKIYALKQALKAHRENLSNAVHQSLMEAFALTPDKKFQRFIPLEREDFIFPDDRTDNYTIIEISVFEGRSVAAKKQLIQRLYHNAKQLAGINSQDLEITIFETPRSNWGIRGLPADELSLNYKVEI